MLASPRLRPFFVPLIVLGAAASAAGQPLLAPPALSAPAADITPSEPAAAADPAAEKRAENAKLLRLAQRNLEAADPADGTAAQQVAHYQAVEAVFAQQEFVDHQIKDLTARKQELEQKLNAPPSLTNEKGEAFSFIQLDEMKDELAAEQSKATLIDDRLAAAKVALEKAQRALEECETKRRQTQEAFDANKNAPNAGELAIAKTQAQQAATLAAEIVPLRKQELERERLATEVQKLAVRNCQEQVARISPAVQFSEADYQAQLEQIKKKEESAHRTLATAQNRLRDANLHIRDIQQQLDATTGDRAILTEKLEAERRARERRTTEIDSVTQRLGRLAQLRVAWDRRYQIASAGGPQSSNSSNGETATNNASWSKLKEWKKETQTALDELAADLRTQIFAMRTLRSMITTTTKKVDAAKNGPPEVADALVAQQFQLEATLKLHESNLVTIETNRRVHEKLLEELGRGELALSPKALALGAWDQVKYVWMSEITHIDNESIYVGKVVQCLAVIVGGWIASRFLSAMFAYRLLGRFRLSKDGTAAIRTLVFYMLLAIVGLAALRTVNVPLTAFTILGGALAIGVGFGSQALINNFIGGLIMLAERPVRLGETIAFGKFEGVVEDVGFRCTKLRTSTDHLVTIPNSTLVNESIENVARRRTLRRQMNVKITYDTPRERVAEAVQSIRDILEEKGIRERIHPIVGFEEHPPRVFFNDYNADGLNILVTYWYAPSDNWWAFMEHTERVNLRMMEEFERLGVDFASPQRTMYLIDQSKSAPAKSSSLSRTRIDAA